MRSRLVVNHFFYRLKTNFKNFGVYYNTLDTLTKKFTSSKFTKVGDFQAN